MPEDVMRRETAAATVSTLFLWLLPAVALLLALLRS
jgi:hypothetical protein